MVHHYSYNPPVSSQIASAALSRGYPIRTDGCPYLRTSHVSKQTGRLYATRRYWNSHPSLSTNVKTFSETENRYTTCSSVAMPILTRSAATT